MDNRNIEEINKDKWIVYYWGNEQEDNNEIVRLDTEDTDTQNRSQCIDDEVNIMQTKHNIEEVYANSISEDTSSEMSTQSSETQKASDDETYIVQTNNYEIKTPYINAESDDTSEGVSVITESDTDAVNTHFFQTFRFNRIHEFLPILEARVNNQVYMNVLIACILGIVSGLVLSLCFIPASTTCTNSNGIDTEGLKTEINNIANAFKDLKEINAMLNEIKTHIPVEKNMEHVWQLFKNINPLDKRTSNERIIESFNSNLHSLDQLQVFVHILSSFVGAIYDTNDLLKNEMDKTQDIVNNTKKFYETLIFNNNTQNINDSNAMQFLESVSNEIHYTSQSLLSDLVKKVSKITLNIYNKYDKMKHKLRKKLCHLRNILPDGSKFLKEVTENNELLRNYEESCFLHNTSKKFSGETSTKKKDTTTKRLNHSKLNDFTEKVSNNDNANIEEENISSQDNIEIKSNVLKSTNNHHKTELSLSYTTKRDNEQTQTADWQFERSRGREQQRQFDVSDKCPYKTQSSEPKSKIENKEEQEIDEEDFACAICRVLYLRHGFSNLLPKSCSSCKTINDEMMQLEKGFDEEIRSFIQKRYNH